jgi:hypothetical protein
LSIAIREADVERDAPALVSFLGTHLADHGGAARHDWLYRRNPFGRARAWIAWDESEGRIVGVAAAFPRPIVVDGRPVPGWNLGDFAVDPRHRTLGPAIRLQRAMLDEVTRGGALAYDHPSAGMLAVYRWMKIEPAGRVVRYAKPLRLDDRFPRGVVGRWAAGRATAVLRWLDALGRPRPAATAEALGERFGAAADALARRVGAAYRVAAVRSTAYLNWRYLDSPGGAHEVMSVVGSNDGCEGFAVVRREGRHAVLRELVAEPDSPALHALLAGVVAELRRGGVQVLSMPVLESSPLRSALRRWGFHPRETTPFVVVAGADDPLRAVVGDGGHWLLADGDRDV